MNNLADYVLRSYIDTLDQNLNTKIEQLQTQIDELKTQNRKLLALLFFNTFYNDIPKPAIPGFKRLRQYTQQMMDENAENEKKELVEIMFPET